MKGLVFVNRPTREVRAPLRQTAHIMELKQLMEIAKANAKAGRDPMHGLNRTRRRMLAAFLKEFP